MTSDMSIWSVVCLGILGVVYLAGFIALVYCAKYAPEGYEDVDGFRLGTKPGAALSGQKAHESNLSDALKQATWQTAAPF